MNFKIYKKEKLSKNLYIKIILLFERISDVTQSVYTYILKPTKSLIFTLHIILYLNLRNIPLHLSYTKPRTFLQFTYSYLVTTKLFTYNH